MPQSGNFRLAALRLSDCLRVEAEACLLDPSRYWLGQPA